MFVKKKIYINYCSLIKERWKNNFLKNAAEEIARKFLIKIDRVSYVKLKQHEFCRPFLT